MVMKPDLTVLMTQGLTGPLYNQRDDGSEGCDVLHPFLLCCVPFFLSCALAAGDNSYALTATVFNVAMVTS